MTALSDIVCFPDVLRPRTRKSGDFIAGIEKEYALVKAAAGASSARMDHLTTIGTFVVRTARTQTSENACRQNGGRQKLVLVLCAEVGLRDSRQMPVCRVTRRPERLSCSYLGPV
jgi:hypothetical protein